MKKVIVSLLAVFVGTSLLLTHVWTKAKTKKIKVGDKAPTFVLKNQDDVIIDSAKDIFNEHKIVVLFFYPMASSPHCTAEACSIKKAFTGFKEQNIFVAGISFDTPEKNKQFQQENNLQYMLLSDTTKEVARAYGARNGMASRFFPDRITLIIHNAIVSHIISDVDPVNHAQQILDACKKIA